MAPQDKTLKNRVYKFYEKHHNRGKTFTAKHFMAEGVSRATIYRILQCAEKGIPPNRRPGSGRIAKITTKRMLTSLSKDFNNKCGISQRRAAKKYGCSVFTINWALRTKCNISYRKKKKIPARTERQKTDAKTKCGRLMRKFRGCDWVLDDESYFTLSHSNIHGNDGYYTSDPETTPSSVKYVTKKKFENKVLVWIAMGPRGMSQPFIEKSKQAINKDVYLKECVKKRLIPYIRRNYTNYVFWPDQASSHYAIMVINHLRKEGINFVEKNDNPANLPEARPVEDFWAALKGKVYAKGWHAENVQQLINRINYCVKTIDPAFVQHLGEATKKRIDAIRRNGVPES